MRREFEGFQRLGRKITAERATRGCFGKRTFDNRNQARDHAKRGEKLNGNQPQDPYRCHICGLWHLTSLSKKEQAKARNRDWRKPA